MTTLVWDEAGARYYETGVSKGIFFPIDGSTGVPWNGLVAVALDPQGGEAEHYYYDGVKYMDRVLAEDFQATIQAITTPKEFESCEGVKEVQFGMKTYFNKRDKFGMAWRTEIGNDQGQAIAYKWHIAYNCLVQPSSRAYQTISDNTTMDVRSFVVTTTPACGRHSYYTFDSRDGDLTDLEAQIMSGHLPRCWDLKTLVGAPSSGGGSAIDPDVDCLNMYLDFEQYNPGQILDGEHIETDGAVTSADISGKINNALDITELPAVGAFAANDSAASEVGTGDILADDDDATYITSADGDLGYTVGLPPLVGYVDGAALELHIRMSISGGVNADDPDNLDADAQVHISTDDTGDNTIGGFSDGADEGMGFALSDVEGNPVDYVIPLNMDAWVDSTLDDVVAALAVGAYLNVVGASNNNTDTTPEVRVYEAKVVMIDDTDKARWIRAVDSSTLGSVYKYLQTDGITPDAVSNSIYVDFKVLEKALDDGTMDYQVPLVNWNALGGAGPGVLMAEMSFDDFKLVWYADDYTTNLAEISLEAAKWYSVQIDWLLDDLRVRVWDREFKSSESTLMDFDGGIPTASPQSAVSFAVGMMTTGGIMGEVVADNTRIQEHCNYVSGDPTFTVDIPVTSLTTTHALLSGGSADAWAVSDGDTNRTDSNATDGIADAATDYGYLQALKYGTGSNVFNWTLPSGAVVDTVKYVISVRCEVDTMGPLLRLYNATRGVTTEVDASAAPAFTWNEWEFPLNEDIDELLINDAPLDRFVAKLPGATDPAGSTALLYTSYLAVRITYTIP